MFAATPCPSPCFPFSPKEYIERFGKKSTKITKEAIQELAKNFAKEIVKRLPKYALTKTVTSNSKTGGKMDRCKTDQRQLCQRFR